LFLPQRRANAGKPTTANCRLALKAIVAKRPNQSSSWRGDGYNLALLPGEAVLMLSKAASDASATDNNTKTTATKRVSATVQIKLAGANKKARISGDAPLRGKSNYMIGADPKKWQTDVPTYARVKYEGVYPGVDAIFYGNQRQLEYDFIVAPGADPQVIRLDFAGAKSVRLDENGELVLVTAAGEVRQHRPVIYQEINGARQTVAGGYKLKGQQASFELGAYDTSRPLVIDPVVSYATFFGENWSKDTVKAIAVDAHGNVYLTGRTNSDSFPVTISLTPYGEPLQPITTMMYVTKLNASGTGVIYSTVISGTKGIAASSIGVGIAVDGQGNASAAGYTTTSDFPTTAGAYRTTFVSSRDDQADAFVLRLNAAGNTLLASTLVGGSGTDNAAGLALDSAGNFCVVGFTASTDLLNNDPAIGRVEPGLATFVAKVSADGTTLIHANVLDAGGNDVGTAIATDAAGNIYVTGTTQDGLHSNSSGARFPRTQGAYQFPDVVIPGYGRRNDQAFIAKFSPSGRLSYSSVVGSGRPTSITLDRAGNPCIVGLSQFIDTVGTFGRPDYQEFLVFPCTDSTTVCARQSDVRPD
jgi:hypothetical protein